MATQPQFGGSNSVPILNLGQAGSGRLSENTAAYAANVQIGRAKQARVINTLPKQDVTFIEDLGWQGQMVTWNGTLRFKDAAEFAAIRSDLERYKTGSTITNGVRGSYDATYLVPTKLVDTLGTVLSTMAIMEDYQFGGRVGKITTPGSALGYMTTLTVVFRIVA